MQANPGRHHPELCLWPCNFYFLLLCLRTALPFPLLVCQNHNKSSPVLFVVMHHASEHGILGSHCLWHVISARVVGSFAHSRISVSFYCNQPNHVFLYATSCFAAYLHDDAQTCHHLPVSCIAFSHRKQSHYPIWASMDHAAATVPCSIIFAATIYSQRNAQICSPKHYNSSCSHQMNKPNLCQTGLDQFTINQIQLIQSAHPVQQCKCTKCLPIQCGSSSLELMSGPSHKTCRYCCPCCGLRK